MAEIINLRRARKARIRAQHTAEAEANRIKHGTPKRDRDLGEARRQKAEAALDGSHIDKDPEA